MRRKLVVFVLICLRKLESSHVVFFPFVAIIEIDRFNDNGNVIGFKRQEDNHVCVVSFYSLQRAKSPFSEPFKFV